MATELLKKETLDLLDIINCIGERPFGMPDSLKDYLEEIQKRHDKTAANEVIAAEELKNKKEEETKEKETEKEDEEEKKKASEKD